MEIRIARREDLEQIVELLADDSLGSKREEPSTPLSECYIKAFEVIEKEANNNIVVAVEHSVIVGCLQLTFIPHLTFKGGMRAQIEAVRVKPDYRHRGIGKQLFEWAIDRAKDADCHLVQLTTNKSRPSAMKFYQSIGFESTHEGVKLYLKEW
ncbi:GNAT family N-acetyltransferase [bacterium]|nr:GNAT family N-acetyltransferase [bacterium]